MYLKHYIVILLVLIFLIQQMVLGIVTFALFCVAELVKRGCRGRGHDRMVVRFTTTYAMI
jgi:hypothetical protein